LDIDCQLLMRLLEADGPVPLSKLSSDERREPAHVQAAIEQLRAAGCVIDVHPQHGVTLRQTGLSVWSDLLTHRWPGRVVEVYRQTASTQDVVRRIIAARGRAAQGAIAIADEQTGGRGRLGRRWHAPAGTALLFSMASLVPRDADPNQSTHRINHLTLITAVGAARGIESACRHAVRVAIKWPNDLLLNGRKLAGILVESHAAMIDRQPYHAAITGIGMNVGLREEQIPSELHDVRDHVASLAMAGVHVDRLRVLVHVLAALEEALHEPDDRLLDEWRQRCVTRGEIVTLRNDGRTIRGEVIDLDPHEGLILRTESGTIVHLPAATTSTV